MTTYLSEKNVSFSMRVESCAGHLYSLGSAVAEMRKSLERLEVEIAELRAEAKRLNQAKEQEDERPKEL